MDLSFSPTSAPPDKLESYHAGGIMSCDVSPQATFVASVGVDGRVRVYDYITKLLVGREQFKTTTPTTPTGVTSGVTSGCTSVQWLSHVVDAKCRTLIAAFGDGVLRVLQLAEADDGVARKRNEGVGKLLLLQAVKPHHTALNAFALDYKTRLLATAVSRY